MVMTTSYLKFNLITRSLVAKAMTSASYSPNRPLLPLPLILAATILHLRSSKSVSAVCELSYKDSNKLYTYNLASPLPNSPHGVLSEDGFYKAAVNKTVIWFQPCDVMLFNDDPPSCVDCTECGGPSRCGMGCSALASNKLGGYPICNAIGRPLSTVIYLMDTKEPHMGVIVKMSNNQPKLNCTLSVSVICDSKGLQGPQTLEKEGICDYATQLRHPAGCAEVVSSEGNGWGWFGIIITIILCAFGGYLLAGAVYRYFFLHIRGIDIIPNLEFWARLPHRLQSSFMSLVRRFRGPSQGFQYANAN